MQITMPSTILALAAAALLGGCSNNNEISRIKADDPSDASMIKLSLAHPANKANNDYELLFATDVSATNLGLCVTKETPVCSVGGKGYYPATLVYTAGGKNFFRPTASALLQNTLVLQVIASDANGVPIPNTGLRNIQFNQAGAPPATAAASAPPASPPPASPPPASTPPASTPPASTPPAGGAADPNAAGGTVDPNAAGAPAGGAGGGQGSGGGGSAGVGGATYG